MSDVGVPRAEEAIYESIRCVEGLTGPPRAWRVTVGPDDQEAVHEACRRIAEREGWTMEVETMINPHIIGCFVRPVYDA